MLGSCSADQVAVGSLDSCWADQLDSSLASVQPSEGSGEPRGSWYCSAAGRFVVVPAVGAVVAAAVKVA